MANNRMTEGVGKKIVEALKMQSEIEINPINEEISDDFEISEPSLSEDIINIEEEPVIEETAIEDKPIIEETPVENELFEQPAFVNTITPQINVQQPFAASSELDDFEIPANIAALKQLIAKLPAGVTKQTGAVIIKQTMEALGISMKSVLQEAQQVQEGLNNSSRECQASIAEYKKQINVLEKQAQKYQRQYAALNDIISLFVQTSI